MSEQEDNNDSFDNTSISEDKEEIDHFLDVLASFAQYTIENITPILKRDHVFNSMSAELKYAFPTYPEKSVRFKQCLEVNQALLNQIISQSHIFEDQTLPMGTFEMLLRRPISPINADKVRSLLRMFVRDWSEEGAEERLCCYQPMLDALKKYKPISTTNELSVLVPGAGLGRLAWECVSLGYRTEGNEFSYHCLVCSSFILNHSSEPNHFEVYPYVHQLQNVKETKDQFRSIKFPNVSPNQVPESVNFSMAAGDFLSIYTTPQSWDCLMTCFFIDTAKNILEYVTKIHQILKNDGIWINYGPLLYHYTDDPNENSIELSFEELKSAMNILGFKIIEEKWSNTTYTVNKESMMKLYYDCIFFVAVKVTK